MNLANEVTWTPGMTLEQIEEEVIKKALALYSGNKTKTAQALGIAVKTIDNKLAEYKKKESMELPDAEKQKELARLKHEELLRSMRYGHKNNVTVQEEKKNERA